MIIVIATLELTPGSRDAFLEQFRKIIEPVRAEAGCIEYAPYVDLQTSISAQGAVRDNVVTVVEKWESVETLEAHLVAPHMLEYRSKVKDVLANVSLQVLESAE